MVHAANLLNSTLSFGILLREIDSISPISNLLPDSL